MVCWSEDGMMTFETYGTQLEREAVGTAVGVLVAAVGLWLLVRWGKRVAGVLVSGTAFTVWTNKRIYFPHGCISMMVDSVPRHPCAEAILL